MTTLPRAAVLATVLCGSLLLQGCLVGAVAGAAARVADAIRMRAAVRMVISGLYRRQASRRRAPGGGLVVEAMDESPKMRRRRPFADHDPVWPVVGVRTSIAGRAVDIRTAASASVDHHGR